MAERERAKKILELQNLVIVLRIEARKKEDLIDALRIAVAARDELAMATINDLTQEKKINLRWEKFAHDAMAEQAKMLKALTDAGVNGGKED